MVFRFSLRPVDRTKSSVMAFDFERYLEACDPDNAEFYKHQSYVSPLAKISDEIPMTKFRMTSQEAGALVPPLDPQNGDHRLPMGGRLLENPPRADNKAVDILESRFRSCQDLNGKQSGRGKTSLFKQSSLPASLRINCDSRAKAEASGRRRRNSVRFADEVGENLTTFVMIPSRFEDREHDKAGSATATAKNNAQNATTSSVDKVDPSTSSAQKISVAASYVAKTYQKNDKHAIPSFQLCFDQPAADFGEFRRRLFLQFVCLENVKVDVKTQADGTTNGYMNHGTVLCTIKVRNLHPIKRVFARCTHDNWKTYADVPAVYVSDGTSGYNEYDTFTFALRNPLQYRGMTSYDEQVESYCRKTASVEFALCYEVLGSTYWDNNEGRNYKIVWM